MSLEKIDIHSWEGDITPAKQNQAVQALESGKVLYFPNLSFELNELEKQFLKPEIVDPKTKNISYDIRKDHLSGTLLQGNEALKLQHMIKRYATEARKLLGLLIPHYNATLYQARTSFRPVEIHGRKNPSYRKDDTLLHVDSFPSSPTQGKRILRLFTNINHEGKGRVWRVGEPFEDVVRKIAPKVAHPLPGLASLLKFLKITKGIRTPYDHYMLQMHNKMKGDKEYQKEVPQQELIFPPGSSWMVYTDQVSHAAMSGQHVLEQTFHLPTHGLKDVHTSPLKVLEKHFKKKLI